ncbi:hypothetical protein JQ506_22965 [Shinella sp. PSBB067]|uniref:hypothetical protein n=1 Tax=Shinella sp. PSBB067 TaxID=2715959 RepID=UPI00193C1DAD|nr:hypothetical protein [Shinella sp. PSBB067]QRI63623.1 hypothetical protein JQ506_22965 [Shinella sp. PSBB067]
MSGILSTRLTRLERAIIIGNPLASLSDEELEARLSDVTARLEAILGMALHQCSAELLRAADAGEPLPEDWTPGESRHFARLIMNTIH